MRVYVTSYETLVLRPHQWSSRAYAMAKTTHAGYPDRRARVGKLIARFERRIKKLSKARYESGVI